jgi:hypothetical protein
MKRTLLLTLLAVLGWGSVSAQLVQVVNEVYYDPNVGPAVAGYPAGHRTYRIYAELQDPTDFMSSIFAVAGCHTITLGAGNQIWNNSFGATLGEAVNIAFCGFVPSLCYDSFVTIGRGPGDPGNANGIIASCPNVSAWSNSLGTASPASNLSVCDGAVYALNGDVNGFPVGPNNRVLLFQVTLPNAQQLTYNINLQIFNEGIGANEIRYVWNEANIGCGSPSEVSGQCLGLVFPEPLACQGTPGCTDAGACNYDPAATSDDGSCEYLSCAGCTDAGACNYDVAATIDDGSCEFLSCAGCTDAGACNYDAAATIDDGSCTYPGCTNAGACNYDANAGCDDGTCTFPGCTNPGACNYDANAGCDNGSCTFPGCNDVNACNYDVNAGCNDGSCFYPGCTNNAACNFDPTAGCDDGSCDFSCYGCTDVNACNFDPGATIDDGSCDFSCYGCTDVNACNFDPAAIINDGSCDYSCYGCTDITACNYDAGATIDDGSCIPSGCTDPSALNYDPAAGCDDGSCSYPNGCTDPGACNFDPGAVTDDGSCEYLSCAGCTNPAACNYDMTATIDDGSCEFLSCAGCTNPGACNYDMTATIDDGSCEFLSCAGCTDPTACNYDMTATIEDGSCTYPGCTDINACNYDVAAGCDNGSCTFPGCTNAGACNYDPAAGCDDGSCDFGSCAGCTDPTACNYDMGATQDDGSCTYPGCTDAAACNYDANAGCNDGSCTYPGCNNPAACNYDANAGCDDGSCVLPNAEDNCAGALGIAVNGGALNIDNSCATPGGPAQPCMFGNDPIQNDIWVSFVAPAASGTVVIATSGDGSLTLTDTGIALYDACGGNQIGCDDDGGTGLFSLITISACDLTPGNTYFIQIDGYNGDSGTCNISVSTGDLDGCTDVNALNYDPCATIEDGSCIFAGLPTLAINPEFFPNCTGVAGTTTLPGANSGLPAQGPFGGNPDDEVFYQLTAPCNGALKAVVDGSIAIDAVVELYDGAFNLLDAADATLEGDAEIVYSDGIVGGDTYYVRVYDYYTGITGSFTICLSAYCASSPDAPYPTLTYQACDVYKCDYIPGVANYNWNFVPQGGGATLTYSSVGNYTFVALSDLSAPVQYGETYDVRIDAVFNDPDLGTLVVEGQITDVCVMDDAPSTELRSDFVGGTYQLNANIRCGQSCDATSYIWRLTPVGGSSLPDVTVPATSTIVNLCSFTGILPSTTYDVEVAVVYGGIQYDFGPVNQINTAGQPVVFLRPADNCDNAGPLAAGHVIFTNAFVPCAKDWTWEFTRVDVPELPIYWKKGNGVRTLKLSDVIDINTNARLLVNGATYSVRVKPEYGNFLGQGNDVPGLQPQYDFATSYGAADEICLIGPGIVGGGENNFAGEDVTPLRDAVALEAALYPNPTNGSFVNLNITNIDANTDRVLVDIYDAFGKLVMSEQIATTGAASLNTVLNFNREIANGVYMVNITVGNAVKTERLVVQK